MHFISLLKPLDSKDVSLLSRGISNFVSKILRGFTRYTEENAAGQSASQARHKIL